MCRVLAIENVECECLYVYMCVCVNTSIQINFLLSSRRSLQENHCRSFCDFQVLTFSAFRAYYVNRWGGYTHNLQKQTHGSHKERIKVLHSFRVPAKRERRSSHRDDPSVSYTTRRNRYERSREGDFNLQDRVRFGHSQRLEHKEPQLRTRSKQERNSPHRTVRRIGGRRRFFIGKKNSKLYEKKQEFNLYA